MNSRPPPPALDRARRAEALATELADAAMQSHAPGVLGESGRLRLLAAVQAWEAHRADLDTLAQAR